MRTLATWLLVMRLLMVHGSQSYMQGDSVNKQVPKESLSGVKDFGVEASDLSFGSIPRSTLNSTFVFEGLYKRVRYGNAPTSFDPGPASVKSVSPLAVKTPTTLSAPSSSDTKEHYTHPNVLTLKDISVLPSVTPSFRPSANPPSRSNDDGPNLVWLVLAVLFVPILLCIIASVRYSWRDEYEAV